MRSLTIDFKRKYFQNYAINGNMRYWQRGTSITRTNLANLVGYLADRYIVNMSAGTAKSITVDRAIDLPTLSYPANYSYQVTNNTVMASLASGDYIEPFRQIFEGQLINHLTDYITIGFWMYSSFAGVVGAAIRMGDSSRSYITTLNTVVGWEYYTVQVDMSSIIIPNNNTAGLIVEVGSISGSSLVAPSLNTWLSGNYITHASVTNWAATTGVKFRFAQFQLREGLIDAAEMKETFNEYGGDALGELAICHRYFEKSYDVETVPGSNTTAGAIGMDGPSLKTFNVFFKRLKRTTPIITYYSKPGVVNNMSTDYTTNDSISLPNILDASSSGITIGHNGTAWNRFFHYLADAEF